MLTPLKPQKLPLLNPASKFSHGANLFNLRQFPDSSALYVQKLFPIHPAVWPHFPVFRIVDPLNPPPPMPPAVSWGEMILAYFHSQMNPQTYTKFGAIRSSHLSAFPDLNLWPLKTPELPPEVLRGELYLFYVHSQTNPQTCPKVGVNRSSRLTASQDFWICDSSTPPPPRNAPWDFEGHIYL